jgi:DNA-binding Lrp family transcriptional regulator
MVPLHDSPIIDSLDRQLIDALQVYPRVSWAQLAPILASSPSTLARRWDTMVSRGVAWSAVSVAGLEPDATPQLLFVEARCAKGRREEAIAALSDIPEVISIDACAGDHDLVLTIVAPGIRQADRLVNDHVSVAPGITRTRTDYASGLVVEGSSYRIGGLSASQRSAVTALRPSRSTSPAPAPTAAQTRVMAELAGDARLPASTVARRTGLSTSHVQRLISQLEREPWFFARTDISVFDFGLIAIYLWVRCPVDLVGDVVQFARRSAGLRMLAPIVSRANLLISVWLPGLDQISQFERQLTRAFPAADIVDRSLMTSMRKRVGIRLDSEGRARADAVASASPRQ